MNTVIGQISPELNAGGQARRLGPDKFLVKKAPCTSVQCCVLVPKKAIERSPRGFAALLGRVCQEFEGYSVVGEVSGAWLERATGVVHEDHSLVLLIALPPLLGCLEGLNRQKRRGFYEAWRTYEPENINGKALFADAALPEQAGAFQDSGGHTDGSFRWETNLLEPTSIFTLGKGGTGKGSQAHIPALLQCPKLSFVVPEIDGDLIDTTIEQRSQYGPVLVMDAHGMFSNVPLKLLRSRYNPSA